MEKRTASTITIDEVLHLFETSADANIVRDCSRVLSRQQDAKIIRRIVAAHNAACDARSTLIPKARPDSRSRNRARANIDALLRDAGRRPRVTELAQVGAFEIRLGHNLRRIDVPPVALRRLRCTRATMTLKHERVHIDGNAWSWYLAVELIHNDGCRSR